MSSLIHLLALPDPRDVSIQRGCDADIQGHRRPASAVRRRPESVPQGHGLRPPLCHGCISHDATIAIELFQQNIASDPDAHTLDADWFQGTQGGHLLSP